MKKILCACIVLACLSCSKEETACYKFVTTTTTNITPATKGYPQTTTCHIEHCGMTAEEARVTNLNLNYTSTSGSATITYRVGQSSTFSKL